MYAIKRRNNISAVIKSFRAAELSDINIFFNSEENANEEEYTFILNVEVDKKSLILKDIRRAELYMTSLSVEALKEKFTANTPEDINEFNESVVKGNLNRLNTLKIFFGMNPLQNNNLFFIDEVDLAFNIDQSTVYKVKQENIPDAVAFGEIEEYKVVDKITNSSDSTTKMKTDYFNVTRNLIQKDETNIENVSYKINQMEEIGLSIIGNNISGLSKYVEQESFNSTQLTKISGRFDRIFYKNNRHTIFQNLIKHIKESHSLESRNFFERNNQSLIVSKRTNRVEVIKKKVVLNKNKLSQTNAATLLLVLYDNVGIRSEIQMAPFEIGDLVDNFKYPTFDFDFSISKQDRSRLVANITNNDKNQRNYRVNYREIGDNLRHRQLSNDYASQSYVTLQVPKKSSKYFELIPNTGNKNYEVSCQIFHAGKLFGNTKYALCQSSKKGFKQKTTFIDFHCKNQGDSFRIDVNGIDSNVVKMNLLKRNLTKKEKKFTLVPFTNANRLDLVKNKVMSDLDVEDKNVYEYKIQQFDKSGNSQISSNSFIEKYCEYKNLGQLKVNVDTTYAANGTINYNVSANFFRSENDIDKVIKSFSDRFFSLFEETLTTLINNASRIVELVVTAYDHIKAESFEIATITFDENNLALYNFSLPFSKYTIKFATRLQLPSEAIEAIANTAEAINVSLEDVFLDKETGNFEYYSNKYSDNTDPSLFTIDKGAVTHIKTISPNGVNKKKNNSFKDQYLVAFESESYDSVSYFIMSYSTNNNEPTIHSVSQPTISLGTKVFYFSYIIPKIKGVILFMAQPVFKDGTIGSPIIVADTFRE